MAVIGVDLDNTLVFGDKLLPGAKEALSTLRSKGHKIIIHTCNRTKWAEEVLEKNGVVYDYMWGDNRKDMAKPLCDLYVDDKGYHFKGDWPNEVNDILARVSDLDNRKW